MTRLLLLALFIATPAAGQTHPTIFRFHADEFWLNLHHFLYVLGRAEAKMSDAARSAVIDAPTQAERGLAQLSAEDRAVWRDAVRYYRSGPSTRDLVFDGSLARTTSALAGAGDRPSLSGLTIEPAVAAALERAAPIYRKAWWPAHRAANGAWRDTMKVEIDRHGPAVLANVVRAYGMTWPSDGYPIHISGYANWAGAYSTSGNLLVISSLAPENRGTMGLEIVFHEAMHQWDDAMIALVGAQARRVGTSAAPGLTHAMIFYTAGDAVRRVVRGHVPYADAVGIWARGMAHFREPLSTIWKSYLDGTGTKDEALSRLIVATSAR